MGGAFRVFLPVLPQENTVLHQYLFPPTWRGSINWTFFLEGAQEGAGGNFCKLLFPQ